ncbi:MAG: type IX secretion system plug protein domain-containing protein, partial [Bacteroidota bacterium]|nr:type IX secretion system plug protein domain-containing protein [Bacteroidota bacterium]
MRTLFFFIIIFLTPLNLRGQIQETEPPMDIKTITFGSSANASGLPIVNLNDRLYLEFDVLNNLEEDFYYVIEHFDH